MCGRFYNHVNAMRAWREILKGWPGDAELGYNISPTTFVPIVTEDAVIVARWGMIPAWSKAFESKYPTHNARIETVHEKPSFRGAWKHSRSCIIPIGGYYEWRKEGSIKQPYVIHNPNEPLVLAGLWEPWGEHFSFTIITEDSRDHLGDVHSRMPVMLNPEQAVEWLTKESSVGLLMSNEHLNTEVYKVSTQVNNSRAQGEGLILPVD